MYDYTIITGSVWPKLTPVNFWTVMLSLGQRGLRSC